MRHFVIACALIGADCVDHKNKKDSKMEQDSSVSVTRQENESQRNYADTTKTQSMAFHHGLIDRLFSRFMAMYGSKFLDMWANSSMDDVKKCWSDELRIFSVEQVGIAVGNLKTKNFPPTLPEFLQLCEAARAQKPRTNGYQALPQPPQDDESASDVEEAKARCMATVKRLGSKLTSNAPSTAWLDRLYERQEAGEILEACQLDSMKRAENAGYKMRT